MWHGLALVFSTCVIWGKSHNFCVALTSYGWCKSKWVKCMSSIVLATMSAWQPTPLNGLKQSFCLWIYDVSRAWQDSFIPAPLDVVSEQHKGWGLQSPESSLTVWLLDQEDWNGWELAQLGLSCVPHQLCVLPFRFFSSGWLQGRQISLLGSSGPPKCAWSYIAFHDLTLEI